MKFSTFYYYYYFLLSHPFSSSLPTISLKPRFFFFFFSETFIVHRKQSSLLICKMLMNPKFSFPFFYFYFRKNPKSVSHIFFYDFVAHFAHIFLDFFRPMHNHPVAYIFLNIVQVGSFIQVGTFKG